MKTKVIILIIGCLLSLATFSLAKLYFKQVKQTKRLQEALVTANQDIDYYKAKNGQLVATVNVMELRHKELKKAYPEILSELENLKIKLNRITAVSETVIENNTQVITQIRDSVINDTIVAKVFNYRDDFYNVSGVAYNDTKRVNSHSTDSLIQVVYKGKRKRPWLWIFSKRRLQQSITTKNPNSKITYSRHIEIVKP